MNLSRNLRSSSFVFLLLSSGRLLVESQSDPCTDVIDNSNTPGGIKQSYTNLNDCKKGCVAKISSTCKYGFDWNPNANIGFQCWFSTNDLIGPATGIKHYNCKKPKGCDDVTNNVNTMRGIQQTYKSLDACKAACLYHITETCKFGFDWNPNAVRGSQCFFSITPTLNPAPGIQHFTCTDEEKQATERQNSTVIITPVPDTVRSKDPVNPNNPDTTLQITTAQNITTSSLANDITTASLANVDTILKMGACKLVYPEKLCPTITKIKDIKDLDGCKIKCLEEEKCKEFSFMNEMCLINLNSSSCQYIPFKFSDSYLCKKGICTENKFKTGGGDEMAGSKTLEDCKYACLDLSDNCKYGFEFDNTKRKCYLRTKKMAETSTPDNISSFSCILDAVYECWTKMENVNSKLSTPQKYNKLDECLAGCQGNYKCVGFNWNPSDSDGMKCRFSDSEDLIGYPGGYNFNPICSCIIKRNQKILNGTKLNEMYKTYEDCKYGAVLISLSEEKKLPMASYNTDSKECYIGTLEVKSPHVPPTFDHEDFIDSWSCSKT